ncbi:MAG: DNA photolyase family protein [bacterium]|nr:DNA photolyase family protein [bacterium]
MYKRAIYWFKRDLRIEDNKAFLECCKQSKEVIPVFIFTPELLEKFKAYDSRLGFIIGCLKNLSEIIRSRGGNLFCYYDSPVNIFDYIISRYKPDGIFTNKAFSWSGEKIEKEVEIFSKKKGISFHPVSDNFLSSINEIPYTKVYSKFYEKWKNILNTVISSAPVIIKTPLIKEPDIYNCISNLKFNNNTYWNVKSGFKKLEIFNFTDYENTRNRIDLDGTSKLSPYIRFGTLSLRRIYRNILKKTGENCQFIKELAWREFWYHIKINFQDFNNLEFQEKRRNIKWQNDEKLINAFMDAKTGYPIIDASIIQFKKEGWMHNRSRMIVANFLTKDLMVDWRIGEKFFMEYLLDYDEVVNVGNWQWSASVGPDPKPLRIFNPIIQAQKFDPDAIFIKKYLPELKNIPSYMLHDPIKFNLPYYKPVVNHFERSMLVKKFYRITDLTG